MHESIAILTLGSTAPVTHLSLHVRLSTMPYANHTVQQPVLTTTRLPVVLTFANTPQIIWPLSSIVLPTPKL